MPVTTRSDTKELVSVRVLRALVRERFEREYLRLRTVDRTKLPDAERELVDRREAELHNHLGTVHDRAAGHAICTDCYAVIDTGQGPRPVLVSDVEVLDPKLDDFVVQSESPLGRALLGARTGDRVRYRTAGGHAMARVLAVEADTDTAWD